MNKHAYLIMAHYRFDLLQILIDSLDDENNDFYVHIDKKTKTMPNIKTKKSKIFYIKRMKVNWGGYSQIKCTLRLIESALKTNNNYMYLHFLTGSTMPIKSKETINNFFEKNYPKEFIGFDNEKNTNDSYWRAKNIHLFNEFGKYKKRNIKIKLRDKFCIIQNKLKYDRFKQFDLELKKGCAYFSITEKLATYILSKKRTIRKMLKYSICGDEIFMQTITYNSPFKEKIFDLTDEYNGSQVVLCWPKVTNNEERINNNFLLKDYDNLINCKQMFALKFEGTEGLELISKIQKTLQ